MLKGKPVTIVGAGIAGLSCAVALAQRGAAVRLLEQADAIREVGAGLQITPNGVAVLDALGLGKELRKVGTGANAVVLRDYRRGRPVARLEMTKTGGARPYLLLHRSDLINLLAEAAQKAGVTVELNRDVVSVGLGSGPASIRFERGQTEASGLLIGADGLHSRVRLAMGGAQTPFFTGQVAWRALVKGCNSNTVNVYMAPGRHLVTYPLRGGTMTNIVGIQERQKKADEGWHHLSYADEFRLVFAQFCPEVRQLLQRVETVGIWGLFRHPVAENWYGQYSALVGDAAHPTLPFLAQGANMALEDAWVLADCLANFSPAEALATYQKRRRSRVVRVVNAAGSNARNYHLRNPVVRLAAHSALRVAGALAPNALLARFDWLYQHDVTQA